MLVPSRSKLIELCDHSSEGKALKISWLLDIHLVSRKPPVSRVVITFCEFSIDKTNIFHSIDYVRCVAGLEFV